MKRASLEVGRLNKSDMRASTKSALSLILLALNASHFVSAILPPFAIAAVEEMWGKLKNSFSCEI